jgi:serine/threonine protein kinase
MEIQCTRSECSQPQNQFQDLDDIKLMTTVQQRYCITCGMPLILAGRYLPIKLLKRGGFGAVFLARDRCTPSISLCIVKQLRPATNLTEAELKIAHQLFEREGQVLEKLGQHLQIPRLLASFNITVPNHHTGKQEMLFYLVQEFIDGQNLSEELAQKGVFSEAEIVAFLQNILPVLQFVHEYGSIHRDIKPSNIMRSQAGQLYLLDFGAVKQATQGGGISSNFSSSTGVFTLEYAAPEQINRAQVYPSTDLYGLAVTCMELLTGKPPGSLYNAYSNQWSWRQYAPASDRLGAIIDRMLLPAPSQRFQSALEVLEVLETGNATVISAPAQIPTQVVNPTHHPTYPPNSQPHLNPTLVTPIQSSSQPPLPLTPIAPPDPIFSPKPTAERSLSDTLVRASFVGFELGLGQIALSSWLQNSPGIGFGILGAILGGLIFSQYRRWLDYQYLAAITGVTLAVVLIAPHGALSGIEILITAIVYSTTAIALTAFFFLVYKWLSRLL